MGSIKFSAIVSAASGKIGGNVFARNASGAYVRSWANPVNPNTAKQQTVRTSFANLISSWKNLSKANQQAWEDMAPQYPYTNRLGESSQYTGQQLYNHLNMNLQVVSATLLTTPLVPETFSNIFLQTFEMDNATGVLDTATCGTSGLGLATEAIVIEVTTNLSGGITKPAKGYFKQLLITTDLSAISTFDIKAAYLALYGSPATGSSVFARAYLINTNTGQRINLGQLNATVTGT